MAETFFRANLTLDPGATGTVQGTVDFERIIVDDGGVIHADFGDGPLGVAQGSESGVFVDGVLLWRDNSVGVPLLANVDLEVDGTLYYRARFNVHHVETTGARPQRLQVDDAIFPAPEDTTPVDVLGYIGNAEAVAVTLSNLPVSGLTDASIFIKSFLTTVDDAAEARAAIGATTLSEIVDGAPGALDTLNELAAALGDDANFATTVTNALTERQLVTALEHNASTNLNIDGSYDRDATWWAGEVGTGKALSTEQAFTGTQSFKLTGARSHFPHVTAAGKTGFDATYGVVKSEGGRLYRLRYRVWRAAGNTSSGLIRSAWNCVGAGGTTTFNGFGPTGVVNQTDIAAGEWVEHTDYFVVPYTGTHSPYVGMYPYITTQSVNAADVFYIDNVRFEDLSNAPASLLAPPPTAVQATDEANVQPLVNLAQLIRGTVVLREGTYVMDIATTRTLKQPSIIGMGEQYTLWDGTLRMLGVPPGGSQYSGGWLSDFSWTGSHAGEAALELNGVCDVHWDRIRVQGTYDEGIWFHNEETGHFTELCNGRMHFSSTVKTALRYTGTGAASFHWSGLTGGAIQMSTTGPAILLEAGARPYNAPLTVGVWTESATAFPVIQHDGDAQANFHGDLTIEQSSLTPLAAGTALPFAGTVNAYMGPGLSVSFGTLYRLSTGVQAVSGGAMTPLPLTLASGGELRAFNTADQVTNYERGRAYWASNVFTLTVDKAGTGTQRNLALVNHGQLIMQAGQQGPTLGTITLFDSTSGVGACIAAVIGTGSAASGTQYGLSVSPTYNQSSTAGYVALLINATETAVGSGTKRLIDAQVGGTSKFIVDNTGKITLATVDLADNTLTGTVAQFNTALSDGDFATLAGAETLTSKTLTSPRIGTEFLDANGAKLLDITSTASAVNYLGIINRASGGSPYIYAGGAGSSLDISFVPKGTGVVRIHTGSEAVGTTNVQTLTFKTLSGPTLSGTITVADAANFVLNATTGTKLGTATTQKLGFWNATPVVQPTAVADATDAASVITQLNALLSRMRTLGLIAT